MSNEAVPPLKVNWFYRIISPKLVCPLGFRLSQRPSQLLGYPTFLLKPFAPMVYADLRVTRTLRLLWSFGIRNPHPSPSRAPGGASLARRFTALRGGSHPNNRGREPKGRQTNKHPPHGKPT